MKNDPNDFFSLLKKHNVRMSKSLGQNFLHDRNVAAKIIEGGDFTKEDLVIEVGPGTGSLTLGIAEKAGKVLAVEIDKNLVSLLEERTRGYANIDICHKDILKADITKDLLERYPEYPEYKVISNLPYYITTAIIMKFLQHSHAPESMVLMMQKEVANRICGKTGTKEYGSLSIAVQYYCKPEKLMNVSPGCFTPRPDVMSTVVRLEKRKTPGVSVKNKEMFFKTVKSAFAQRRKKAVNSISSTLGIPRDKVEEVFLTHGLDPLKRAEQLCMEDFARISDSLVGLSESLSH
ncbi:MAG: 16S rRNA (adenine(1518)-N(6)/adenine(1519)-N(6))-dimethyltransferase RsmA [Clostridia bacterium]